MHTDKLTQTLCGQRVMHVLLPNYRVSQKNQNHFFTFCRAGQQQIQGEVVGFIPACSAVHLWMKQSKSY